MNATGTLAQPYCRRPHSPNASYVYREIGRGHRRGREMIFMEKTLLSILVWSTGLEHDSFGKSGPVNLNAIATRRGRP